MARPLTCQRRDRPSSFISLCCLGSASGSPRLRRIRVSLNPILRHAVLATAPKELKLWFNEGVEPAFAKAWIVPAQGAQIPLASRGDSSDPRLLIVALPDDLAAGPVVIGYHILSVDGDVVEAQLTFTIKKPG